MAYRKEYAKLQAQARRDSSEMLKLYKELYPEKFVELQAKAKYEVEHNIEPERPVTRYAPIGTRALSETEALQIVRPDPNIRDYYIHTKDAFGDPHLLFESGYTPEAAAMKGQEHWPRYAHEIVQIEPCSCPLCVH